MTQILHLYSRQFGVMDLVDEGISEARTRAAEGSLTKTRSVGMGRRRPAHRVYGVVRIA
ncbi:hypothetical protein RSSM_04431 [Rhodopirellula sallentina SM41]|uniref:Uncharacterized protein n=1 Tax=Rhodopirellula sallentina SM41 TaxID=1263870 RepID=M5TYM2_9BACT|nr:hypothetical protein RSSM_04431 [Rhodopirellula sallentina SM41]